MHLFPNGKKYFGITKRDPRTRWRNGNGYKYNPQLYGAINKYGWDNIEHKILFSNLDSETAKKREVQLVALYDSTNFKKGYNRTKGGDSVVPLIGEMNGMYGQTHTNEARESISKFAKQRFANKENHPMYGKPRNDETKRKLKEANVGKHVGDKNYFYGKSFKGENSPHFGVPKTEEAKKKMSEAKKGVYVGKKSVLSRPVVCINTNEFFWNAVEAKRKYGYDNSAIIRCCRNKQQTAYGNTWRYANEEEITWYSNV